MKIAGQRCQTCGHQQPDREIADDEACACSSRFCLLRSAEICLTTNRPRTGTMRTGEVEQKSPEAPPRDRMVRAAAVRK